LNDQKIKPLIIIGGGGHASILVDILRSQNRQILALISPADVSSRTVFSGIPQFKNDEEIHDFSPKEVLLVNGIGMLPRSNLKRKINEYFISLGYHFESVIADSAIVSRYAHLGDGVQVFPGSIIQTGAIIGDHSIINSGVIIEHDANIGRYNHIAPRTVICGQSLTQEDVFVGAGATVIQNIMIAEQAIVAAGAIVTASMPISSICYPTRAKIVKVIHES
jgi:sugar O-acyltransferase (sialic acid O-acetyltransferase NeuD family)